MKKAILFAFALVAIGIISSCKKSCPNDQVSNNPITFGDTTNMYVVKYDSSFMVYYKPYQNWSPYDYELPNYIRSEASIDLNNDGTDDVFIESGGGEFWPFCSNNEYFSIHVWSGTTIRGISTTKFFCDRVFCNVYIHNDTTILHANDSVIMVTELFLNYKPISESDAFSFSFGEEIHHAFNAGDQLPTEGFFTEAPRALYQFPCEMDGFDRISNDTIYYNASYEIDDPSYNFPLNEEKYIGFVIKDYGVPNKYGWIKILLISQPDGTHRMRLLETAIQK